MTTNLWGDYIARMDSGLDLAPSEIQGVLDAILDETADIESIKAFLLSLHNKGESAED